MTEDERREVRARLKQDRSGLADEYNTKYLFDALKDWKIYVHMIITIGNSSFVSRLTVLNATRRRYLHPFVLDLPLPSDYCQEHGIYEQPVATHERSSLCPWLHYHYWWWNPG